AKSETKVQSLEEVIFNKKIELANINSQILELEAGPAPKIPAEFCTSCHDREKLVSFHYPEKIKLIDEYKNKTVRICTKCHGQVPHDVHRVILDRGGMTCQACHMRSGEFRVPKPKEGQLLICELCHSGGSYIRIHIDGEIIGEGDVDEEWRKTRPKRLTCTNCHMGSVVQIHKEKTIVLGKVPENFTLSSY
ncbi:MAG: hypothetical protein ACE5HY_04685, partial [Candidatus Hydrothermarchaeales archaeon]